MSATSPLGLRYPPITGVTPNVPRDLQNLAEDTQTALGRVAADLQEGVIDAGSFEVTQASGGASTTVDVASNVGNGAYVQNDAVTGQALFYVAPTGAKTTVTITAAHATLPRVDAVVVSLAGVVSIVAGTATSGATLDNARDGSHGGAAIPSSSLHLADLLVPATDTTISNNQIRDRRKWARGAYCRIVRNANAAAGNDYTTTSINVALIDSTNLAPRIECSGAPLRLRLVGVFDTAADSSVYFSPQIDSVGVDGMASVGGAITSKCLAQSVGALEIETPCFEWVTVPSAGSHIVAPGWGTPSSTLTLFANAGRAVMWEVEEILRQNTRNNATTTG